MILWFSGTGNSRYVAERLAAETGERVVEMRRLPVSSPIRVDGSDRRVVWVCPVYSWGIPPYVRSVISRVGFDLSSLVHHLVLTCGDDCGLAPEMWRKDIGRRGWQTMRLTGRYDTGVTMTATMMSFAVDSLGLRRRWSIRGLCAMQCRRSRFTRQMIASRVASVRRFVRPETS